MHNVTITPGEIRETWARIQTGEARPFKRAHPGILRDCVTAYGGIKVDRWIGASGAQIQDRLEHGYDVAGKDNIRVSGSDGYVAPSWDYSEDEGDLVVDMALAGEELYRVQWVDNDAPKSLTIKVCMGMASSASADVIGAYMEWTLKVIDAAVRDGYVPSITLWAGAKGGLVGREDFRVEIPLAEPGEVMDVTSWRAYLTPGSFRSLGFVAFGLAADKLKKTLVEGYGSPMNKGWGVTFDAQTSTLEVACPITAGDFPEELMDRQLAEAFAG